jgi:hypothetical protein
MSTHSVEVVVLCEDRQQEYFIRRFLQKRGRQRYEFRPLISPAGRGSGEQWVRERFPRELKAHRSQVGRRNTWLIVATDADTQNVESRINALARACDDASVPFRAGHESVIFVIPKRNIETWFAYLRGEQVNEAGTYRRYGFESDCRHDVTRLDEMCQEQKLEPEPPPSLVSACLEFKRLSS